VGQTVTQDFTGAGQGNAFGIGPQDSLTYSVTGTYTGAMYFERSNNNGASWESVQTGTSGQSFSGTIMNESTFTQRFRWRSTVETGTAGTTIADVDNVSTRFTNRRGEDRVTISDDGVQLYGVVKVNGVEI